MSEVKAVISLEAQMMAFLAMILGGFMMGLSFDIYSVLRRNKKAHNVRTGIGDLLYWLLTTIMVLFLLVFYGNWGEVRVYVYLGILIGIMAYRVFFSSWIKKGLCWFLYKMGRFFACIYRITLKPIVLPLRKIIKAFRRSWKGMMG